MLSQSILHVDEGKIAKAIITKFSPYQAHISYFVLSINFGKLSYSLLEDKENVKFGRI